MMYPIVITTFDENHSPVGISLGEISGLPADDQLEGLAWLVCADAKHVYVTVHHPDDDRVLIARHYEVYNGF